MSDHESSRIYLSPPHLTGEEEALLRNALRSNWIAPLGPHVDGFEKEFASEVGATHAVALSSGTAALHLALQLAGVERGSEVVVSTLTFVASANPVRYLGATPVFVDCDRTSWNLDPGLLQGLLSRRARKGRLPAAVEVVHLYGQAADMDRICDICAQFGVPVIEDAAEALGATYRGRSPGTFGRVGTFSFNGNKIITTSGGGMLVTADAELARDARNLASQARDPAPHYEHSQLGYNYRLSNLLAAVGRAQLKALPSRVAARQANFRRYRELLGDLPGLSLQPEAPWGGHSRWLTVVLIDEAEFGASPLEVREALEAANIEARPIWKPMHLQPLYSGCEVVGGGVSEDLFLRGLCLPSGSSLGASQIERVAEVIRETPTSGPPT